MIALSWDPNEVWFVKYFLCVILTEQAARATVRVSDLTDVQRETIRIN
jgi:hypothetical protein